MRILAGDIGGTNTRLASFEGAPGAFSPIASRRYPSASFVGLAPILTDFLARHPGPVDAAAFGVAGPVVNDTCRATNLPWVIDARALEIDCQIPRVTLRNDFEAIALGVDELTADDLLVLQDRAPDARAPGAVLGAGTGLGEAILLPRGRGLPSVLSTEGGHTDFPPRDDIEIGLLRFLQQRHGGRVSIERVLSGPGLVALYEYVVGAGLAPRSDAIAARIAAGEDPGAVIGEAGVAGTDAACRFTVERFVSIYGAEAGNLALKTLPYGGLFVAGGIAPKLAPILARGDFIASFRDKGRMEPVLDRIRVSVVMDTGVGLLGARRAAVALIDGSI